MGKESILGELSNRVRTCLWLPKELMRQVDEMGKVIGIPKNALIALAAGFFIMNVSPLLEVSKRKNLWIEIEKLFQRIYKEARKSM